MLLSVALTAALAALAFFLITLEGANSRIEKQKNELDKQSDLIDKKETFGAAMETLLDTTAKFEGVLVTPVVPMDRYQLLATSAWAHRWDADALDRDIASAHADASELEDLLTAANLEATTNTTGTTNEAVIDQLGGGFATSLLDNADALCESDVLACVRGEEPYTVHFDAADYSLPYMTDWLRTGLAYHEFAHVLQNANPEATGTAVEAFGGDVETMADCFALTYLDGWTLDHRIWVSSYQYWDVSIGYGYACNDAQKQVVRDWYGQLGFTPHSITQ